MGNDITINVDKEGSIIITGLKLGEHSGVIFKVLLYLDNMFADRRRVFVHGKLVNCGESYPHFLIPEKGSIL